MGRDIRSFVRRCWCSYPLLLFLLLLAATAISSFSTRRKRRSRVSPGRIWHGVQQLYWHLTCRVILCWSYVRTNFLALSPAKYDVTIPSFHQKETSKSHVPGASIGLIFAQHAVPVLGYYMVLAPGPEKVMSKLTPFQSQQRKKETSGLGNIRGARKFMSAGRLSLCLSLSPPFLSCQFVFYQE